MTSWNIVILTAMLQGILLALFLIANKKGNRTANIFLSLLVFLYSIDIGLETLYASPQIVNFPYLIGFNDALFFLYGPLLYFYAYFLTSPKIVSNKKLLIHFLPFLAVVIAYIPTLYLQSTDFKLISEGITPIDLETEQSFFLAADIRGFVELASGFHQLIYFGFTLLLLRRHENTIKETFSAIDRINLNWLRNLTFATGVIVSIDILLYFFVKSELLAFGNAVLIISLLCALLIYAIGYMGLRQPLIFSQTAVLEPDSINSIDEKIIEEKREKYYKSTLTEEQAEENLANLLELMETEKLYLDGEIKLSDVAESLGISNNNLSQIINDKLGKNFYDFINQYRVETAKTLLVAPKKQHLTLLAIAFDSGFNSKSSFNSVFKKQSGLTPSEFKKSIAEKSL